MAHEEWRDVVGYEGIYQISSIGRVKSLNRLDNRGRIVHGRMRRVQIDPQNGYPCVQLYKNNKGHKGYIHRLIAEAFLPNPHGYECVDHINGVRTDSYLGNLRWCSRLQNIRFAIDAGTIRPQDKADFLRSGIAQEAARKANNRAVVRSDGKKYESITAAAKDVGHSKSNVWAVIRGIKKTCGGYSFRYANN